MKKVAILVLGLLISTGQLYGNDRSFEMGLRFNPNLGWTVPHIESSGSSVSVENNGVRAGFSWGIDGTYWFLGNYGLASEIRLNHLKGSFRIRQDDPDRPEGNRNYTFDFRYIDLPISLKLRTPEIGYFTFFGRFGVTPGVNINRRGALETQHSSDLENDDMNLSDEIKLMRMGLEIALGTKYALAGTTAIQVSLAYNNGMFNIIRNNPSDNLLHTLRKDNDFTLRNNFMALNIGIIF